MKVEVHSVSLKSVIPAISKDKKKKEMLVEDLARMGCEGLLLEPWSLKSEAMAQEFQHERSNKWEGTIRWAPERWMADTWVEVYSFQKEGKGLASTCTTRMNVLSREDKMQ